MPIIKRICRLCLSDKPSVDIFYNNNSIKDKIIEYCGVNVYECDGLPQKICNVCFENVNAYFDFKSKCQETDLYLRKKLLQTPKVENKINLHKIKFECDDPLTFFINLPNALYSKIDYREFQSGKNGGRYSPDPNYDVQFLNTKVERKKTIRKREKVIHEPKLCPQCGMMIAKGFDRHLRTHFKHRVYICDICKREHNKKSNLIGHLKIHEEKKNVCQYCGKLFTYKSSLKKHIDAVHMKNRLVQCEICKKMVHTLRLKEHLLRHTGLKRFECDICNKKFTSKGGMVEHLRTHTGEKPFKCSFCKSKFRSKKSFQDHERLHTGETPYECSVCSRGYAQLSNLKSHFKNNHKGMVFSYKRNKTP